MKTNKTKLKWVLFICVIIFSNQLNAQIAKSNWLFEGSIGNISFSNNNSKNVSEPFENSSTGKSFGFFIIPTAGYFITDNLALGSSLSFGFGSSNSENSNKENIKTSESSSTSMYTSVIPFIRYYFPGKEKLRFYSQVGAGIDLTLFSKSEGKSYNYTTGTLTNSYTYDYPKKYVAIIVNGQVGAQFFISNSTAINSSIGYLYSKSNQTSTSTSTDSAGISTTTDPSESTNSQSKIQWQFGFTIYLDKQKN